MIQPMVLIQGKHYTWHPCGAGLGRSLHKAPAPGQSRASTTPRAHVGPAQVEYCMQHLRGAGVGQALDLACKASLWAQSSLWTSPMPFLWPAWPKTFAL